MYLENGHILSKYKSDIKFSEKKQHLFGIINNENLFRKKNFMPPFYGWVSIASRLEPLRRGSLLFTTKNLPWVHLMSYIYNPYIS